MNPQTKEEMQISATKAVGLRASKALKNAVACGETFVPMRRCWGILLYFFFGGTRKWFADFKPYSQSSCLNLSCDDLQHLCRLVSRGLVRIDPLIRNVVSVSEAKRIYDTLCGTPNELFGTVFIW